MYIPFLLLMLISICPACGTESESEEPDQVNSEFIIPWPDGGEIITDEREGNRGQLTIRYENSAYESVVEFYEGYASGRGWNRSETGQGEVPTINYMNLADGQNISVDPPDDQIPGAFIVTLMVS